MPRRMFHRRCFSSLTFVLTSGSPNNTELQHDALQYGSSAKRRTVHRREVGWEMKIDVWKCVIIFMCGKCDLCRPREQCRPARRMDRNGMLLRSHLVLLRDIACLARHFYRIGEFAGVLHILPDTPVPDKRRPLLCDLLHHGVSLLLLVSIPGISTPHNHPSNDASTASVSGSVVIAAVTSLMTEVGFDGAS